MTDRGPLSFNPVEGHRRYADDPEPSWYSGPDQYTSTTSNAYDSGVHERPSGAFRLPEQRDSEYLSSPYVTPDPVTSPGGHSGAMTDPLQDQVRIPVRGPEYPTIRPSGGTSLADAPPTTTYGAAPASAVPTTYGGGSPAPVSAPATYGSGSTAPAAPVSSGPVSSGPLASGPVSSGPVSSAPPGAVAAYNDPTGGVPPISRFAGDGKPADTVYRTRRPLSAMAVAAVTVLLMVPVVMLLIHATFVDDPVARGIVPAVLLTLGLPLTGAGLSALAGGGPVGREALLRPPVAYLPVGLILLLAAGLAVA
jgi:hypothetical protein